MGILGLFLVFFEAKIGDFGDFWEKPKKNGARRPRFRAREKFQTL